MQTLPYFCYLIPVLMFFGGGIVSAVLAVVRERGLSSGRVGLASGGYLGLECCRLLAPGLGWLEELPWRPPTLPAQFSRTAYGFGNPVPFEY